MIGSASEIKKVMKMAIAYGELAPGRLLKKSMAADGAVNYEATIKREAMVRFLFPQFAVEESHPKYHGFQILIALVACRAMCHHNPGLRSGLKRNWEIYLQSDVPKSLTPFQLALTEFAFGYKQ